MRDTRIARFAGWTADVRVIGWNKSARKYWESRISTSTANGAVIRYYQFGPFMLVVTDNRAYRPLPRTPREASRGDA